VLRTVLDALARGYITFVLEDAIRAVEVAPGDGDNAVAAMQRDGAAFVRYEELLEDEDFSP
jgi:nicotinamidase/pyrazinamidase